MSRRLGPILIAAALATGGLGGALWWLDAHLQEVFTDDGKIEQPLDRALPRDILWQPPEILGPSAVQPDAIGGAFRADGRFAFAAPGRGGDLDLFEAVPVRDGWEARRLEVANSPDQDTTPTYSPDGRWLYFASDRPGGAGGLDLWRAPATGEGWGAPEHVALGNLAPSPDDEFSPALSPDGALLAYTRRADADSPADLVLLALHAAPHPTPVEHALNTPEHDERSPAFSPAGDFLYFASDRAGGAGGLDLYRARLTKGRPAEPAWLGEEVNTPADETDPALNLAGFRLRFRSHSGQQPLGDAGPSEADARSAAAPISGYRETTAREVYRATRSRWPSLAVSDELLRLLPWLLLLLALAFLFSGLRRLAARELWQRRWRTLGLMSRCVLASMALHALLALLLSIWRVDNTLPGLEQGGETRVSLTSHAAVSGAAAQLNAAALTATPAPPAQGEPASTPAAAEPGRFQVAASDAAALPTVDRIIDAAAPSPAPESAEPSTAPPSLEAPAFPSAAPSRAAEARSRDAPVETGRIAPHPGARAAEQALVEPAETAASGASTFEVAEAAPTPALAEADAYTPPPATEVALATPVLPMADPAGRTAAPEERATGAAAPSVAPSYLPAQATIFATSPDASSAPATVTSQLPAAASTPAALPPPEAPPATSLPAVARAQLPTSPPGAAARTDTASTVLATETFAVDVPIAPTASGVTDEPVRIAAAPAATGDALIPESLEDPAPLSAPDSHPAPALPLAAPRGIAPMLPVARVIAGVVLNADTGEPVPGALVRLDGEGDLIRSVRVGGDGRFSLTPADLPEFAALTASAEGFAPTAANIAEADVGDGMWIELRLEPASRFEIALDPEPRVHHLGNDQFTGRINSQFQVASQGTRYSAVVRLEAGQLADPIRVAELHVLVRGAQNPNRITVNGRDLDAPLTGSPEDGSFGPFIARIPLEWLHEGDNEVEIEAVSRRGTDIDDIEFVNPRLLLKRRASPSPGQRSRL